MTNSKTQSRTLLVLLPLAAMSVASVFVFENKSLAAGLSGKIATTTFDGETENHFSSKDAVYLSGGPVHEGAAGLPDGTYYFQVTGPSGNDLLSTDLAVCRQLIVFNGVIAGVDGPSCQHATGIPNVSDGATPIKMMPFIDTPNPGGNYKAWLIAKTSHTTVAADGKHIDFKNSDAKSEVFKADSVSCPGCGPTVAFGGRNFYDLNENAVLDEGEAPVEGVKILVLAGDTPTVVTTNSAGIWSATLPTGVEFMVLEFLPYTGPSGEPGSYWEQTAPVADSEGSRRYVGTATANLTNLHFGNLCFIPNAQGIAVKSLTPCPVSDVPPPDPTPAPTATPCNEGCPNAVLSGKKFYDTNANALFDEGEVTVQGVQIAIVLTTSEGTTLTFATTNADGNWSLTVPSGAQYIISEYLPDTDPETEPGGYWEQTGPLPNDEGFRGYSGTASEDQGGFDFGNVCFHEGNPFAQAAPCGVRYPAPPPSPTPTPTPL